MDKATVELKALIVFLIKEHDAPMSLKKTHLRYTEQEEELNEIKPRFFCGVDLEKPYEILCSFNINQLPFPNRLAILLHELAHIILKSSNEVEVDEYCKFGIPASGFGYQDKLEYESLPSNRLVIARNVEVVSETFCDYILETYME